ncbi:NACHT domain-containing protein [Solwaraspora sp. WMMD791]|uniref:NACHT domain-containing protein n=1 Tax=Solwaraspora sp. WMMD791 TaxID=3016086 RepID=UPI00249CB17E|nr:NACHT domain-containing protein [Solwaraspora sp. WMMD791]WFE26977.1 NACHT domain-containing protein [Solwaraspora sp. WMMD791]
MRQLPFAAPDFSGRTAQIATVNQWLDIGTRPTVVNVAGLPGSGKSALAIHLAHQVSDRFPDCQLYFDFRSTDQPIRVEDLLSGVLVQLGVQPAEVPSGLLLRSAYYRSALADRRSVIVIDNASSAAQVEPLLPGDSDAVVLITSWMPLAELPGVRLLPLRRLPDDEATAMLAAVAMREITEADQVEVRRINGCAGNLPLALRIAGAMLKARPHWTWGDLARRLGDPGPGRLRRLTAGELSVQASIDLAYRELPPAVARGYRLLGLAPSALMNPDLVRALVADDADLADEILDQLIGYAFLQPETDTAVRMHDLLWLRARQLAAAEDQRDSQRAAQERMVDWSLNRLNTDYLPQLQFELNLLPALARRTSLRHLRPADLYVDTPLLHAEPASGVSRLADVFPARRRLMLVAPGGTGKTTMVNHLCHGAAQRRLSDQQGPLPIMVLLRDWRTGDDDGVSALIRRSLTHRYGIELTPDTLDVALRSGQVFVVLDGLDEVVDRARRETVASVRRFAAENPQVPMLVTTRPYATLHEDLPGFDRVGIRPWDRDLAASYLASFGRTGIEGFPRSDNPAVLSPLGLQMALSMSDTDQLAAEGFTGLMEEIVNQMVYLREYSRGTLEPSAGDLREALERVAYRMQSSSDDRIVISGDEIGDLARRVVHDLHGAGHGRRTELLAHALTSRVVVLRDVGRGWFAFTHTAFREHLAASHLARMSGDAFIDVVKERLADASWMAVFSVAVELIRRRRNSVDEIIVRARERGDSHVADAIEAWR